MEDLFKILLTISNHYDTLKSLTHKDIKPTEYNYLKKLSEFYSLLLDDVSDNDLIEKIFDDLFKSGLIKKIK